ncbi:S-layer homology domain-containing protein [Cohnella endophytica]|uniref:S-layer homology domain-containing protein n=1 Tax=Cohnella endophytica TaxID=2419778 RepID=A0A494XGR4_9BACL|nr:S-layer homology domain-containing protein [Cohnella endophytica]RKP47274.1 S-layer homology domain-containing protein [Cohnella endophytica]
MKKLLSAFLALVLAVTLVPAGLVKEATAASSATYFIPDTTGIRDTALRTIDVAGASTLLTRANAYTTNTGNLTVKGTFAYVSATTMSVKIDQLNLQQNGTWTPDATHFTTGSVQEDTGSTNRFTAGNLTLFSGMNRITFTGMQGSIQRSDVFYVLYDQIPYLQSLKVISGSTTINLNEGAQAVVPSQTITLQGVAKNANKATVSVNGGTAVLTSVLDDGTFFSPALTLQPGLNSLKMSITNGTNTINITRDIYYFDLNKPYTDVKLVHSSGTYQLLNNIPQLTTGGTTPPGETATLDVTMLAPYSATAFGGTATYNLNGSVTATIPAATSTTETIIPGADGITPQYKLIHFVTPASFPFDVSGGAYLKDQVANLTVTYGTFSTTFNGKFKYLPGDTAITKMQYLPGYDGTSSIATAAKEPLNGAEVSDSTFYILVDSDKVPTTPLLGSYLPLSTTTLTLTLVGTAGTSTVYKVDNFANGQQKIQFKYTGSSSTYNADITYVQKSYIYVANLYDGQTYTFDSRTTGNKLTVSGQYMGFKNLSGVQYFVNGIAMTTPVLNNANATAGFSLDLTIGGTGPLVFGENKIVFKGVNTGATGISQEIIKEIKIYLIDTNVSTISRLQPTLSVATREAFTSANLGAYTSTQMANIFAVSPEFTFKTDKYVTSETGYDLVMRGGGASILNLKLGSDSFFTKTIPVEGSPTLEQGLTFAYNGTTYYYDFAGDQKDFILRIRDIKYAAPGSHVYNLELINSTGARTNQTLEITREVSPYRILSPQPTVGNQIIVNKNFVRFDIEAEGATDVLINGISATKRADLNNRFTYDFVGLKADKQTAIKVQIKRADTTISDTVQVYYTSTVQVDSQFMQKLTTKFDVFNKNLQLTFPKGTVLKSANTNTNGITKLYNDTMFLFGIADPVDGVVDRRNDYGNIINVNNDARTYQGASPILIPDYLVIRFGNNTNTTNFTRISPTYWISGGVGELGNKGQIGYKPATNGLAPYSVEGRFTEYELERKVIPTNRGQLTLKYDTNVVDEVGYTVSVFRYTDKGDWENIGGEVDTKKHTITVPFDDFGYYMVVKLRKGFTDITNHTWARNILNALYSKGIMNNVRFDEFGANDMTTRGEFATLLVKGMNLPINAGGNQTFFDITPGTKTTTWDYEHIETAARAGIVTGLDEGFFGAGIPITRQEAAVMIARAMKLKMAINDTKLENNLAKAFVDSGSIHYYARPAIDAVNKAKIMTGTPVTVPGQKKPVYSFNPKGYMTRAEAGKITVELLKKSTSIFPKNLS